MGFNSKEIKVEPTTKKSSKPKDVDYISKMGYRDDSPFRNRASIDIHTPNGIIDMSNTGIPLMANGAFLPPYSGQHQFDTNIVTESRMSEDEEMRYGGLKKRRRITNNPAAGINDLMLRNPFYHTRKGASFVPYKEEGGSTGGWLDKYQVGGPKIDRSLMGTVSNPSETVNQPRMEDPYVKAAIQKAADERERLAYIEQEKQRKANEDKVRTRVRAQQALDIKNKVPGKELYDEDYEVQNDIKIAEYQKKIKEQTNEMMGNLALGLLPIGELAQGAKWLGSAATKEAGFLANRWGNMASDAVNASKESGILSNAHKLNPWSFKPNPESYYRVIGKNGYKDAIENNIIRPKLGSNHAIDYPTFKKGIPLDNRYASSNVEGLIGDNSIMVESNGNKMVQNRWTASAPDKNVFIPRRTLTPNTEGVKFYQKDWLQGYQEVPKELPGSPNSLEGLGHNPVKSGFPNPLAVADALIPMPSPQQAITLGYPLGSRMSLSPMNIVPGYGKIMKGKGEAFRKFGNSMDDVIERQLFGPSGGSKLRMGRDQIVNEGNWANAENFDEAYSGVFGAKVNPKVEGTNLSYSGMSNRNGVLIKDKAGNLLPDIPIEDPGLSFHRRLPFSNRYVPIDKQKLIDKKFQLATQLPYVQSLGEKYVTGLGFAAGAGALGAPGGVQGMIDTYNKYTGVTDVKKKVKGWLDNYK